MQKSLQQLAGILAMATGILVAQPTVTPAAEKMDLKAVTIHNSDNGSIGVFRHEADIPARRGNDPQTRSFEFEFVDNAASPAALKIDFEALLEKFVVESTAPNANRPTREKPAVTIGAAQSGRRTLTITLDADSPRHVVVRYEHPVTPWSVHYRIFLDEDDGDNDQTLPHDRPAEQWVEITNDTLTSWKGIQLRLSDHAMQAAAVDKNDAVIPDPVNIPRGDAAFQIPQARQLLRIDLKVAAVEKLVWSFQAGSDPKQSPKFPALSLSFSKLNGWPKGFDLKGEITVFQGGAEEDDESARENALGVLQTGKDFPPKSGKDYVLSDADDSLSLNQNLDEGPYKLLSIEDGYLTYWKQRTTTYTIASDEERPVRVFHTTPDGWTVVSTNVPVQNDGWQLLTAGLPVIVKEQLDEPEVDSLRLRSADLIPDYLDKLKGFVDAANQSGVAIQLAIEAIQTDVKQLQKDMDRLAAKDRQLRDSIAAIKEEDAYLQRRGKVPPQLAERLRRDQSKIRDLRSKIAENDLCADRKIEAFNAKIRNIRASIPEIPSAIIRPDRGRNAESSQKRSNQELGWILARHTIEEHASCRSMWSSSSARFFLS